jgi:pseudouridine synthase
MPNTEQKGIRLNRYLAMCGVGARRKAEEFILAGKVAINGVTVTEIGSRVFKSDVVEYEGKKIVPVEQKYLIYNKPRGLICAVYDARAQTVIDILPPELDKYSLFPVGRLDKESEGLLILTNDGMFSQELIHPSKGIPKTYEVELRDTLTEDRLIEWSKGVRVEGLFLKPISVRRISRAPLGCRFEVVLGEGIKREIRLMVRSLDNDVRSLVRRKIGKLELRKLKAGEWISVGKEELWSYIRNGKIV